MGINLSKENLNNAQSSNVLLHIIVAYKFFRSNSYLEALVSKKNATRLAAPIFLIILQLTVLNMKLSFHVYNENTCKKYMAL